MERAGGTVTDRLVDATPAAGFRSRISLRDVATADLEALQRINQQAVPAMNSLSMDQVQWFVREAELFRVAILEGQVGGFLVCLDPSAPYGSPNLRWLNRHRAGFLYIDRVAVAPACRRQGVATALYRDAASWAGSRYGTLACEVNVRPLNRASIRFHRRLGFECIGTRDHGYVKVQYMVRDLPL